MMDLNYSQQTNYNQTTASNYNKKRGEQKRMGLINTNYKVLNTTTTAYAAISKLVIEGASGYAIITISDVRENAIRGNGIKNVRVDFKVSREENPFITAYKAAKTDTKIEEIGVDTIIPAQFKDWTDSIYA